MNTQKAAAAAAGHPEKLLGISTIAYNIHEAFSWISFCHQSYPVAEEQQREWRSRNRCFIRQAPNRINRL